MKLQTLIKEIPAVRSREPISTEVWDYVGNQKRYRVGKELVALVNIYTAKIVTGSYIIFTDLQGLKAFSVVSLINSRIKQGDVLVGTVFKGSRGALSIGELSLKNLRYKTYTVNAVGKALLAR